MECEIGTGTRAFKDKYVASEHEEVIPEINERFTFAKHVMEVQAPSDKYFYNAEKPLAEQNEYIRNCIFDHKSLQPSAFCFGYDMSRRIFRKHAFQKAFLK